jgi:hypothetical protein
LSEPLRHVSGLVAPHQLQQLQAIGGSRGLSAGLRDVVSAGLLALRGDSALIAPVSELHDLADKLAKIQGRTTPSGAWWAPSREALPSPDQLDPAGAVLVTPRAVGLIADGAVVIDLEASELAASLAGHEVSTPFDLNDLAAVAALLPAALAGLAAAGPGRRDLGHGLAVQRTTDDLCRISLKGIAARCSADVAQSFAAELVALVARTARASAQTRMELNRQLEVSP